ncbi:MAG: translocation/assembly module TamB domain-containing protein [Saprospiraceae bacterium]
MEGRIPDLEYDGMTISAIDLDVGGDTRKLNTSLRITDFVSGSAAPIPLLEAKVRMYDDSLFVAAAVEGDTSGQKLRIGLTATEINGNYRAIIDDKFVLNDDEWQVTNNNAIIYDNQTLQIENLSLKKNRQEISINTRQKMAGEQDYPIAVAFSNFKVSEISDLLDQPDAFYEGRVNGEAIVRDYQNNLHYEVDMNVTEIALNEEPVGDLSIQAEQASGSKIINIAANLSGQNNDMAVKGTYNIPTNQIDLDANIAGIEMRLLDPFMADLIKESRGKVNGEFAIAGTPDELAVNGQMTFNEVSTVVEMLGIRYAIQQQPTVTVSNTLVDLGSINLVDENNNTATFSGQVKHEFFTDFLLDLKLNTDRFQVLNTTVDDNELYYGQLFASASVNITGDALEPSVNVVSARTLSGSKLFIQPLSFEAAIAQEDFIIFANPADYEQDTTISINEVYEINNTGVDLLMNLAVTDDAELQIIIDPTTGDKLVARGNANVTVEMNPAGDVAVTGNYVLTSGTYNLNYQGVLKKEFVIQPGSNISLVGDPLNSRFDISAIYTAKTTTYELVTNEANLSASEESATKQRTEINVVMQMLGTLDEPLINFDIRLPESLSSTVSSTVARKLSQLKENETEMNKQVFGLLLLGSFITPQSGGGSIAGVGQSAALRSASNLISNQLNSLADRFVKGVDLTFGVDSYQNKYAGDSGGTVTELQVGLSKSLFDDRLSVTVGGNVNVGSSAITGGNNTAISSEFVVEYKLTEAGNYLFRVFRRPDVTDILSQDNDYKTGVGLIFQKTF